MFDELSVRYLSKLECCSMQHNLCEVAIGALPYITSPVQVKIALFECDSAVFQRLVCTRQGVPISAYCCIYDQRFLRRLRVPSSVYLCKSSKETIHLLSERQLPRSDVGAS